MEYLYAQSGVVLVEQEVDLIEMIDEGIEMDTSSVAADGDEGEQYQHPLHQMIAVASDDTPQDDTNVEVCSIDFKWSINHPSNQMYSLHQCIDDILIF